MVDLLAVRKDHGRPVGGIKRGDAVQLILIQIKGGGAAFAAPNQPLNNGNDNTKN